MTMTMTMRSMKPSKPSSMFFEHGRIPTLDAV